MPSQGQRAAQISIHALHEESDAAAFSNHRQTVQFQSTLSMRRATTALSTNTEHVF